MTATVPASARERARLRRRFVSRVLAVAVACGILGAGAAPSVAATTPSPSPTIAAETSVIVAPLAGGIITAGQALAVTVGLSAGDAALPQSTVSVSIGTSPLSGRDEILAWTASGRTSSADTPIGSATLDAVAAGERAVAVVRADVGVQPTAPGVYPVLATVTSGGEGITSASVFVIPGEVSASVGMVVPLTAPAISTALLDAAQLAALTGEDGALAAALSGVAGTGAILAIDPAVPAAIRALGASAPESATVWLERMEALPLTRFALQFGDADPAAQAAAGVNPPLEPLDLSSTLNTTNFITAPSPTPSATPGAVDPPTLTELLDIGGFSEIVFWPQDVTGEVVSQFASAGAATLVSSDAIAGADASAVPSRAHANGAALLVADEVLSEAFSAVASAPDAITRSSALATATALHAVSLADAQSPVLIALDRDAARNALSLRAAVDGALGYPGVSALPLPALLAEPASDVTIRDQPLDAARVDAIPELLEGERQLAEFSSILTDPTLLTATERAEILQLLGIGWSGQDDAWAASLAAHHAATDATLDAVDILPTVPIQQVAAGSDIPVWIRNDLPYPVTVTLHARPDDLRLEVAESTVVSVGATQSLRAILPVQSRIGSGTVHMDLYLTSATGVRIGDGQQLEINVRADWEGIGLVVLAVLAGGFLTIGVVRTVIRLRRRPPEPEDPQ